MKEVKAVAASIMLSLCALAAFADEQKEVQKAGQPAQQQGGKKDSSDQSGQAKAPQAGQPGQSAQPGQQPAPSGK